MTTDGSTSGIEGTTEGRVSSDGLDMDRVRTDDLVETEGVNSGSADSTQESAHVPAEGDVLGGGDADAVPTTPDTEDDRDLTGTAPGTGPDEPGFEGGTSGQDSGLMS